jgi:hypothetical protein
MHASTFLRVAAATGAALAALAIAGPAAASPSDSQLLSEYQPVTIFDVDERLRPIKVNSFIRDSVLERFDGTGWVLVDADPEPDSLPGPGTGVWRLNQSSCSPTSFLGGLDCYAAAASEGGGGDSVYGRVFRLADAIVLQYWYFYYDNTYSYAHPASDFIWQAHEGDWEVVNVVLTADGLPVSAGYSQHCLGERRAWDDVPRSDTHPVVYVAAGSHANYFSAGEHPYDPRCVPLEARALLAQLGLPLPRDHTSEGEVSGPKQDDGDETHIRHFDAGESGWTQFPGFWGELQYFHAPFVGTVAFGTSPVGPAYKPIWHDPITAMATWPQS